jgi:hypothetical protein
LVKEIVGIKNRIRIIILKNILQAPIAQKLFCPKLIYAGGVHAARILFTSTIGNIQIMLCTIGANKIKLKPNMEACRRRLGYAQPPPNF